MAAAESLLSAASDRPVAAPPSGVTSGAHQQSGAGASGGPAVAAPAPGTNAAAEAAAGGHGADSESDAVAAATADAERAAEAYSFAMTLLEQVRPCCITFPASAARRLPVAAVHLPKSTHRKKHPYFFQRRIHETPSPSSSSRRFTRAKQRMRSRASKGPGHSVRQTTGSRSVRLTRRCRCCRTADFL